ncbi:hypothetical protein [Coraliomargarita parva]|uniref:hypothetical protein n=1 Tax=Coraliomargarita parva TaxID=3014050 RepID=UPI0022B3733D|nr:hypothetical protein [Coraliomargarita parva]
MPHVFQINPDKCLIHDTYAGDMTVDEIKYVLMEISMHKDFDPDFDAFTDMLDCNFMFGPEEQDEIVELFESVYSGGSGRSAVLINNQTVAAKAKSHADIVKPVRNMRVFDKREDALRWLGRKANDISKQEAKESYPCL